MLWKFNVCVHDVFKADVIPPTSQIPSGVNMNGPLFSMNYSVQSCFLRSIPQDTLLRAARSCRFVELIVRASSEGFAVSCTSASDRATRGARLTADVGPFRHVCSTRIRLGLCFVN